MATVNTKTTRSMNDANPKLKTLYQFGANNLRDMSWVTPELVESSSFQGYTKRLSGVTWEDWNSPKVKQQNIELMGQKSSLTHEVIGNKQGWLFPEKVYVGDPNYFAQAPEPHEPIDRYIMRQPMCHSLKTRFHYVSDVLVPNYIRHFLAEKGKVRIASFGSGTGRDVIEAMTNFGDEDVTADLYDVDQSCLRVGREIAKQKGLEHKVRFIQENLTQIDDSHYDVGLLVGVICPVPDRHASIAMKRVKRHIHPDNGVLITSSSSEKMESDDPLSRFLIEYTADWFLQFRDENAMHALNTKAGYETVALTAEPTGYHRFVIGTPRSKK